MGFRCRSADVCPHVGYCVCLMTARRGGKREFTEMTKAKQDCFDWGETPAVALSTSASRTLLTHCLWLVMIVVK